MRPIDPEKIYIYLGGIVTTIFVLVPLVRYFPRKSLKGNLAHDLPSILVGNIIFIVVSFILIGYDIIPEYIQNEIFSPGGVAVISTIVPIYESIGTICSPNETYDRIWLQYWISSAMMTFSTEFVDDIAQHTLPMAGEHWYEFEFLFHLWLMLPMTNGSQIVYYLITKPYITPIAYKIKIQFEGYIGLFLTIINTSYIWILWLAMVQMDEETKRFLVVALGTVYPIAASTIAITSDNPDLEETYWLTYWVSFIPLYLAMDYLENFYGTIPGFYGAIACATVYLFLPVFGGAEIVFRRVLVPISGQYKQMLLHDVYIVKRSVEKAIPENNRDEFMRKCAELFTSTSTPGTSTTTSTSTVMRKKVL